MAKEQYPTEYSLRALAVKHGVAARTILKALKGEEIRGAHAEQAANAAAAEWRRDHNVAPAKRARAK